MKELDTMQRTEISAKLNYRWVDHFILFLTYRTHILLPELERMYHI